MAYNILYKEYMESLNHGQAIIEHLPILLEYANKVDSIIELGVNIGHSTVTFLISGKKLRSYDIRLNLDVLRLFTIAKFLQQDVEYIEADTLNLVIEECDLLFIDTKHTYEQLSKELLLHGNKAKKYIIFHDTHTFGTMGEDKDGNRDVNDIGLLPAVIEFVIQNPNWRFIVHKVNNNGLTILERT